LVWNIRDALKPLQTPTNTRMIAYNQQAD
jgi:hypothetical protein